MKPIAALSVFTLALLLAAGAAAQDARRPPQEKFNALVTTYDRLRTDAGGTDNLSDRLLDAAMRGMVREADPDNGEYYDAEAYRRLRDGAPASATPGLELGTRDAQVVVRTVLSSMAAHAAGVLAGDVVIAIDGAGVFGKTLSALEAQLRGAEGSAVTLKLWRPGADTVRTVELTRRAAPQRPTEASRIAPQVLLLRPSPFKDRSLREIAERLSSEWKRQAFSALVLDLRGHSGGLLSTAVGVSAMFLPPDVVVMTMVARDGKSRENYTASPRYYRPDPPGDPLTALPAELRDRVALAVLTDDGTAAGAEIVAAALQDHRRAKIVGQRSFGRATVQTALPLSANSAIKFTTHEWVRSTGAALDRVGLVPDVPAEPARAVDAALELLRGKP